MDEDRKTMQNGTKYKIGDIVVRMNCRSPFLNRQCEPYRLEKDLAELPEIDLSYTSEIREKYRNAMESDTMFEYNYTLSSYAEQIVEYNGFCFHASALAADGEGILFSADSGTGKSTHADLWEKYLKEHEIIRLNDDKPVIRMFGERPVVYGSPWAGKHSIHTNASAPVKALVFLEQGADNKIERISSKEAFPLVFSQVLGGKSSQQQVMRLMELLDRFMKIVPAYKLKCNISEEAALAAYRYIWEDKR